MYYLIIIYKLSYTCIILDINREIIILYKLDLYRKTERFESLGTRHLPVLHDLYNKSTSLNLFMSSCE